MTALRLVGVGGRQRPLLDELRPSVARSLGIDVSISSHVIDPGPAYRPERDQYHSTALLEMLRGIAAEDIVVGVTGVDLFVPILTYVFGEAEMKGHVAIVSYRRLAQPFYGLPDDPPLLLDRLIKEVVHEAGHTLGLTHCHDHLCVMASSHGVEWIDVKTREMCVGCISQRSSLRFASDFGVGARFPL
jgi:archaemetzincin